jgi:hypothetical protein
MMSGSGFGESWLVNGEIQMGNVHLLVKVIWRAEARPTAAQKAKVARMVAANFIPSL